METPYQFLLTIGGILLVGLLASQLARHTFLPRITLLLLIGALIGEEGLHIVPHVFTERFEIIADITLLMVGFLLGGKLSKEFLQNSAKEVFWIAISAALMTVVIVSLVLILIGVSKEIAIILGCIASATAPAAVMDVAREAGKKNKFSDLLLMIVALDDVLGLILFGIGISIVKTLNGQGEETFFLLLALKDIGGAILLGLIIGIPAAYLTGRIKLGELILTEALAIVFICGGLAIWLDVSFLIAAIVLGATLTNLSKHQEDAFNAIREIEGPFMVVFFFLAGASLELGALKDIGYIGLVYIIGRSLGKYLGARIGSEISRSNKTVKNWMGSALLPQAGVAIGMALVTSNQLPEHSQVILPLVISTTVIFEIFGPIFTRIAIQRSIKNQV